MSINGIDISNYQGSNPNLAGLDFEIVKATEGTSYINPKHAAQVANARAAGLVVGHYHFAHSGNIPAQVDYFLKHAGAQRDEFLALDWENPSVTSAEKDAFLKDLKAKSGGRRAVLYCNTDYWTNRDHSGYRADGLWIAQYNGGAGHPNIKTPWLVDQWTSSPLDRDVAAFGSRAAMAKWAGSTATPKPVPKPTPSPTPKPGPAPKPVCDLSNVIAAALYDPKAPQGHGLHAADTKLVEAALRAEGHLPAKYASDGSFGSLTRDAYKLWQKACGYSGSAADGIPGKASLTKLGAKHGFTVKA